MVKRVVLAALLGVGLAAAVSAQGHGWGMGMDHGGWGYPGYPVVTAEAVTVSGNLTIVQGSLAVKSGDITYLVSGLSRYVGFIDTLKDGARVSIEGAAVASPQDPKIKLLRVNKLTIGGKDYDLARPQMTAPVQPRAPAQPMAPFGGRRR